MQIYLPEVKKKQGEALQYRFRGRNRDYCSDSADDGSEFTLDLSVRSSGDEIMVVGTFQAEVPAECSRCLRSFRQRIGAEIDELFTVKPLTDKRRSAGELALETANQFIVSGDYLYLDEYVRQLFVISQIYSPLCKPDCRGLCAGCGADLNESGCSCSDETLIDSRLQKLKDFRPDR